MSMTGSTVKEHVDSLVEKLALEKRTAENSLQSAQRQLEQNQLQKAQQLGIMAQVHLSAVMDEKQGVHPVSSEVSSLLAKRDSDFKALEVRLESEHDALAQSEVALRTAQQTLDSREKAAKSTLENHQGLKDAQAEVTRLEHEVEKHGDTLKAMKAEASQKAKAYLEDRFFSYLFHRHYGTERYVGRLLFRRADAWLAGKINFDQASRDFAILNELPTRAQAEYDTAFQGLEATRGRSQEILEGIQRETGVEQANERLKAAQQRLVDRRKSISSVQDEMNRHMEGTDSTLKRIKGLITKSLEAMSLSTLDRLTTETANRDDDLALSTYRTLVEADKRVEGEIANMQNRLDNVSHRFRRAKSLRDYCESNGYDQRNRIYERGFDLTGLLEGYMLGRIEQSTFGRKVEAESEIYVPRAEPSDNGFSGVGGGFGSLSSSDDDDDERRKGSFRTVDSFGGSSGFETRDSVDNDKDFRTVDTF